MPDLVRRSLAEAIATFFLVFIGVGAIAADASTGVVGHLGVSLSFGFVVAAMVYTVGHLSGAHLNPAVTLAFRAIGRFPAGEVPAYIVAQLLGASTGVNPSCRTTSASSATRTSSRAGRAVAGSTTPWNPRPSSAPRAHSSGWRRVGGSGGSIGRARAAEAPRVDTTQVIPPT